MSAMSRPDEEAALKDGFDRTMVLADRDGKEMREHADAAIAYGAFLLDEQRFDDAHKKLKRARDIGERDDAFRPYYVDALTLLARAEIGRGFMTRAKHALDQAERTLRTMRTTENERTDLRAAMKLVAAHIETLEGEAGKRPAAPTEKWRHPTLGEGVLVSKHDDKVRLRFSDGAERVFIASRLERLG